MRIINKINGKLSIGDSRDGFSRLTPAYYVTKNLTIHKKYHRWYHIQTKPTLDCDCIIAVKDISIRERLSNLFLGVHNETAI